jgi:hypothetical protein
MLPRISDSIVKPKPEAVPQCTAFEVRDWQTFGTTDKPDENRLAEVSPTFSAFMMEDQRTQTAMMPTSPQEA